MRLLVVPLLMLLVLPACQLTPTKKSAKARKAVAVVKRQPLIVLIPPELLGQECVVEERLEDEKTARTYTGKLVKFNDDIIELETPELKSKTQRDRPLLGPLGNNVALVTDKLEENKLLMRNQVASINAAPTVSE